MTNATNTVKFKVCRFADVGNMLVHGHVAGECDTEVFARSEKGMSDCPTRIEVGAVSRNEVRFDLISSDSVLSSFNCSLFVIHDLMSEMRG